MGELIKKIEALVKERPKKAMFHEIIKRIIIQFYRNNPGTIDDITGLSNKIGFDESLIEEVVNAMEIQDYFHIKEINSMKIIFPKRKLFMQEK
jgi:UDP-N-acetylglucosamine transferase subunit ALG13